MLINNNIILVYLYNEYMASTIFSIVLVLVFIIIFLFLFLFLILYNIFKNNNRKKIILKLSENIQENRIKKYDIVLSRIKRISYSNPKFAGLYERLSLKWDKMSDSVKILNNNVSKLLLNYKKIRKNNFKKNIYEINEKIKALDEIELTFKNDSLKITRQDDFTRSEKSFYDKNLRIAISVYKDKRILLNKISEKIDSLVDEISIIHKEFDIALAKANTLEINKKLILYSKKVIKFCKIINKGPSLQNYIYKKIPQIINDLYKFYIDKKNKAKIPLKHINFSKTIKKISLMHVNLKTHFSNLQLNEAEFETKNIFKSIKIAEKMINFEIKSRKYFIQNYNLVVQETKLALMEFVRIRSEIKNINSQKINVSLDFKRTFQEFLDLSKIIDYEGIEFRSIIKNDSIPFSSKLSRMKLFSQKLYEFIIYLNKINEYIFELDISRSILKNKFFRAKNAFNNLLFQIKDKSIKIDKKLLESTQEVSQQIFLATEKIIEPKISSSNVEYIENVINNIIHTYKLIAGTIEISNIIKNLINKLSIDRAINNDLNYQLGIAEKEYLEGKYTSSLNSIIQHLERTA